MVLQNPRFRDAAVARALSYLHVLSLRAVDISFITCKYPSSRGIIRWAILRFGIRAAVSLISKTLKHPDVAGDWKLHGNMLSQEARAQLFTDIMQGKFKPGSLSMEPYLKHASHKAHRASDAPTYWQPLSQSPASSIATEEDSGTFLTLLKGIQDDMTTLSRKVDRIEVNQHEMLLLFHENQSALIP